MVRGRLPSIKALWLFPPDREKVPKGAEIVRRHLHFRLLVQSVGLLLCGLAHLNKKWLDQLHQRPNILEKRSVIFGARRPIDDQGFALDIFAPRLQQKTP